MTTMRRFRAVLAEYDVMAGSSWDTWWIALIGAFGEKLSAAETETFRKFTGRNPPKTLLRALAFFVGRRGGKDTAAAIIVIFQALCRRWPLAAGEVGVVQLTACDRDQVQIAFKRILGILRAVPEFAEEIVSVTRENIVLENGIEIAVTTSDLAAVRGRTVVCSVLDEYAFWPQDQAIEVPRSMRPSMATQPGSLMVVITTIYASNGPAFDLFNQWGEDDPTQLIFKGTSRDFNPQLSEEFVAAELARDYAANAAEYLTIPRTDCEALYELAKVERCTRSEGELLPKLSDADGNAITYFGAVDLSGARDDTGAAISHREGDRVITDVCRAWRPPMDVGEVAREITAFFKPYRIAVAYCDAYAKDIAAPLYRQHGLSLELAEANTTEIQFQLAQRVRLGTVQLPADDRLRRELLAYQRRTTASGRDTVEFPRRNGSHGDLADAVARASWAAGRYTPATESELVIVRSTVNRGLEDLYKTSIELQVDNFNSFDPTQRRY